MSSFASLLIDNQTPFFSAENMRQEKEADITDIDMITQLPDPILQHILLFLPTAGAGLTYGIHSPYCTFPLTKVLRISKAFCLWLMILCPLYDHHMRNQSFTFHSFVLNLHLVRERRPFDIKRMLYLSKIISMVGSVWF